MTNQDKRDNLGAATAAADYQLLFPEIFYQLQPYVVEACDQLEAVGSMIPTKEMMRSIGDKIERRFEFPGAEAVKEEAPAALRSRGLFRDLLDILILTELFGRRRRYY